MRDPDGVGGADGLDLGIGLVDQRLDTAVNGLGHFVILPFFVIPGWSEGPDPESRDSGFDASHRPGMATMDSTSPVPSSRLRSLRLGSGTSAPKTARGSVRWFPNSPSAAPPPCLSTPRAVRR